MKLFNEKTIVQVIERSEHLKTGYLYKRGEKYNTEYKKRYFVLLHSNILCYYHHKGDKEPIGVIFLEGHIVELVDEPSLGGKLSLVLKFPLAEESCRSYTLAADTSHEIEEWMQAITRVGIDYVLLSVEDLQEQVSAMNFVGNLENKRERRPSDDSQMKHSVISKLRSASDAPRTNPFDSTKGDMNSFLKQINRKPTFDPQQEKYLGILCSDFEALHFKVKSYWIDFETLPTDRASHEPQLISTDPPVEDLISF